MKTTAETVMRDFRDGQLSFTAQEIGLLVREVERLRSALRPFADYADASGKIPDDMKITQGSAIAKRQLTMVDCRRAAATLKA